MKDERCPACGEEMKVSCWVGDYRLCRKCSSASSVRIALKISKSKHRERLIKIWEALNE